MSSGPRARRGWRVLRRVRLPARDRWRNRLVFWCNRLATENAHSLTRIVELVEETERVKSNDAEKQCIIWDTVRVCYENMYILQNVCTNRVM
jgi:hypothetical protein